MSQFKSIRILIPLFCGILFLSSCTEKPGKVVVLETGEKVWAGIIWDGHLMPLSEDYSHDFYGTNKSNQLQPLLLTNKGQFVWSEEPFKFEMVNNQIIITDPLGTVVTGKQGSTLAEVQRFVSETYFPASGLLPDTMLLSAPQYNTWIELNYHQSQKGILEYAHAIIDNGLPPGVIMLDDTWQEDYGFWNFHPGRFSDPKAMMDELHSLGFKVMLWVVPFVSADQSLIYHDLRKKKAFLVEKEKPEDTWETAENPIMIRWWNGVSALLDFSNPVAVDWFNSELDRLVKDYGVDGFKFDAADMQFYPKNALSKESISPNEHCRLYTQFGLKYPMNEYRACWKMGGQPLAQRLHDKKNNWEDLQKLIPQMIIEGLNGYTFSCPDTIGGGLLSAFEENAVVDQALVVRSAQCHALMPMMQFSVAPWRILDEQHLEAIRKCVGLRMKYTPLILQLAHESAKTGEPIMKNMEYVFPDQGFESVIDQFMLGNTLLVAPMVQQGKAGRDVMLPAGSWKADDGTVYEGGKVITIDVPLERLPYFEKL